MEVRGAVKVLGPTAGPVQSDKSVDKSVVSNIFYFHPYLGKIPILTNIFQLG